MVNGVRSRLFLIGILLAFSLINVSATNSCSDPSQIIFRLSADTNAHVEFYDGESEYTTSVCYNQLFSNAPTPGTRECAVDSTVLILSDYTNAHAEGPNERNYNAELCYRDLECTLRSSCIGDEVPVVRLSDDTNAHLEIADKNNYNQILCCSSQSAPGEGCSPACGEGNICSKGACVAPPAASCGNGVIDVGEGCDGTDFEGKTCESLMSGVGSLSCKSCVIDTSRCIVVGAGLISDCSDGKDNDNDGLIDFPRDPGCYGQEDDDETDGTDSPTIRSYWANANSNEFVPDTTAQVGDSVKLVVAGIPSGSKVVFTIFDDDGLLFDDEIATSPEVAESGNNAIYSWNIVPSDFQRGSSDESDKILELYFLARIIGDGDHKSPNLFLTEKKIDPEPTPSGIGCGAYNDEDYLDSLPGDPSVESACNDDIGRQLGSDPEYGPINSEFKHLFDIGCNDKITRDGVTRETFCYCTYERGSCFFGSHDRRTSDSDGDGILCTGSCKNEPEYSECVDNLQTIKTKGTVRDVNSCNAAEIDRIKADCTERESVEVICGGSRLLLPFFGEMQFLISALTISAIYMCLVYRKRR